MVRRAHEQQDRRIEPDVGVLSCASASRGADRSAAQVRWRAEMCCDGYPGAVVLTAPSDINFEVQQCVSSGIAFLRGPIAESLARPAIEFRRDPIASVLGEVGHALAL